MTDVRPQVRWPYEHDCDTEFCFRFLMAASLAACGGTSSGPLMQHKIGLVYFAPEEGADMCMKGIFDGLKEQGSVASGYRRLPSPGRARSFRRRRC